MIVFTICQILRFLSGVMYGSTRFRHVTVLKRDSGLGFGIHFLSAHSGFRIFENPVSAGRNHS
jgi:hypothetical protein